jgi:hypothetical protein
MHGDMLEALLRGLLPLILSIARQKIGSVPPITSTVFRGLELCYCPVSYLTFQLSLDFIPPGAFTRISIVSGLIALRSIANPDLTILYQKESPIAAITPRSGFFKT